MERAFERFTECSTGNNSVMSFFSYHNHKICVNVGAPTLLLLALLAWGPAPLRADEASTLLQADSGFVHAFQKKDAATAGRLLSPDFIWIDSVGRRLTRAQALAAFPAVNNAELISEEHIYGNSGVVRANRGKVNVLRVWVRTGDDWRILLYQEVTQVEKSEPVNSESSGECINPCKEIPYQAQTPSEKEAIASWQGVMKAMAENDADAYAPLIADEFTATDTFHDRPYTKADRLAQIQKQKASGKHNAPPELLSAEMFDFGETVLMIAREQRRGAKAYFNSRMWVKRDARWQMLFSFNTRIEQ
jgi:ketosteroid isomerase-like protein